MQTVQSASTQCNGRAGVSQPTIYSGVEKRMPSLGNVLSLARLLGCPIKRDTKDTRKGKRS
jgi:hypothetical protein